MIDEKYTKKIVIRWTSSFLLVCSLILAGNNMSALSLIAYTVGLFGWFVAAMMDDDRALMVFTTAFFVSVANDMIKVILQ